MNNLSSRQFQGGYLLEIPILFMVVVVVLSIILPNLPPLGQKIALAIAAVPILFALFYMIVIPGWMPGDKGRLRPPWNWIVFLLVAAAIITVVVAFALAE
jgi:membrane protease YdiL (CAAX protease family)